MNGDGSGVFQVILEADLLEDLDADLLKGRGLILILEEPKKKKQIIRCFRLVKSLWSGIEHQQGWLLLTCRAHQHIRRFHPQYLPSEQNQKFLAFLKHVKTKNE